jgi:hypothetical protein
MHARHGQKIVVSGPALVVGILLDHGFGAVGVAINSAPTEGVPSFRGRKSGRLSPS